MTLHVQSISAQVYDHLRDYVIAGRFAPAVAIRQEALANELGVSKIPVREALIRLEREGLIRVETNRGFFVVPLTQAEARDVYSLRLQIEPPAVAEACRVAGARDHAVAKAALEALNTAASSDRLKVPRANRLFHLSLVKPLDRPVTLGIIERLHLVSERNIGEHLEPAGGEDQAHVEHATMFEHWVAGRAQAVEALVHQHIEATFVDLMSHY
ncbi:hypothetical protein ABAC460_22820 [Asticcacaulis sp. AC460]|uniref:GntR family transcriptional regulator n=1 Tax=Asticcacaulis sp. AC460 TaxID=1282360 RepID=UPI0003C3F9F2|nr:GntR family transcriptional regulator [Asticcacaulis sp. AC460]ESQ86664.1 hypothetical protein ABAC460_22820 [Asticcacaulis sp. AC460]